MATPVISKSKLSIADALSNLKLSDTNQYNFIDTDTALSSVLDTLDSLPTHPPSIYIDLEGEKLSRHGTISIMQIHVRPTSRTYLIDLHVLRQQAFDVCGSSGQTLESILESRVIPKVFFDVRNDSDALYKHFSICLAGIQDLQLMELATRSFGRKHVNGLAKCVERDGRLSATESLRWKDCKEKGVRLFAPERGAAIVCSTSVHCPMTLCNTASRTCILCRAYGITMIGICHQNGARGLRTNRMRG